MEVCSCHYSSDCGLKMTHYTQFRLPLNCYRGIYTGRESYGRLPFHILYSYMFGKKNKRGFRVILQIFLPYFVCISNMCVMDTECIRSPLHPTYTTQQYRLIHKSNNVLSFFSVSTKTFRILKSMLSSHDFLWFVWFAYVR